MKNTIITILIILVLCLGGYLVYDKVLTDQKEPASEPKESEKSEDYDLKKAKELIDDVIYFGYGTHGIYSSFEEGYLEITKKIITLNNISAEKVTCDSIYKDSEAKYNEEGKYYEIQTDDGISLCDENSTEIVSYDEFNKMYKSLFGSNEEVPKKGFELPFAYEAYNEKTNSFVLLSCGCGGYTGNVVDIYDVIEAKKLDNKIMVQVVYSKLTSEDDENIYTVINNTFLEFSIKETEDSNFNNTFLKKYRDIMPTYRFEFEKENDNYVLKTVVKELLQ